MKRIPFGRVWSGVVAGMCAVLLLLDCGSPDKLAGSAGTGGSAIGDASITGSGGGGGVIINLTSALGGAAGTGVDGGYLGDSSSMGLEAGVCGSTVIEPSRAPVDILIVLDRSGSMYYSIAEDCYCAPSLNGGGTSGVCANTTNCTDRWTAVRSALGVTIVAQTTVNWGLELFSVPGGTGCNVSALPQVPIAADSGDKVLSLLASTAASSNTPTAAGIRAATAYMQTVTDTNSKAILLATDGLPNCPDGQPFNTDDMPATQAAVGEAAAAGFPVYVVGMGPAASIANLGLLAQAGGTGNYYPANSPQALASSLATISKIVSTTCVFQTPIPPPDPNQVFVYVDKTLVAQSADDGWTFVGAPGPTITLTGSYCADHLAGSSAPVQILFGCPNVPPQPPPFTIP